MKTYYITFITLLFCLSVPLFGQIPDPGETLKEKAESRTSEKIDQGIDTGLDKAEEGVMGLFKSKSKQEKDKESEPGTETKQSQQQAERSSDQELKTYSKFDFIPGEKIIFFDDFADVAVGDFPLKWNTTISGEVIETNKYPGKWFKFKNDYSYYSPEINFELPENFTLEFDALFENGVDFSIEFIDDPEKRLTNDYYPGKGGFSINPKSSTVDAGSYDNNVEAEPVSVGGGSFDQIEEGQKVRYSIWGQKQRVRVYVDNKKVVDLPRLIPKHMKINFIRIGVYSDLTISNFRFAEGAPDTRSRLLTEGKLVTHGITFDSGSDKIKPESYGVLKVIAKVLKENTEIQVKIVGHTDSDGDENSNMILSKRRSAAVKDALVNEFDLDGSRMITGGKGETEPVDSNKTPEGKANNRRVEFIKI